MRGLWRWSRRVSHLLRGAPGAPGTAAARAHSQGHLTEGPGLTPPPAFLLAFICLPRPNCFQICNFKGSGTPLGRALLAPRGPQSNAPRERTAGPAGRQGSGQAAGRWAGLGAGKAFSARGAAELSGAAQPLPDPAGLWRGPHGLWAQGMSPRATSEAIAGAVQPKHPLPGPAPLVAAMPSPPRRARPPTPPPTWEPGGRRGPGALWIGGSARPPHPIPEQHSESLSPVGRPQADLLSPPDPQLPAPPGLPAGLGPAGAGNEGGGPRGPAALFQRPEKWKLCEKNPQIRSGPKPTGLHKAPGALSPARGLPASG